MAGLLLHVKTRNYLSFGKIKGYSSKVLREEFPQLKSRLPSLWTRSKFVSTCGDVTLEVIKQYSEGQSGK